MYTRKNRAGYFRSCDFSSTKTLREQQIEGGKPPPGVVKMKKVFQCQLLLGGESEKQRENKVVEENEPPHQETDSWKSVWSNVGYKLKRALSELEAQ